MPLMYKKFWQVSPVDSQVQNHGVGVLVLGEGKGEPEEDKQQTSEFSRTLGFMSHIRSVFYLTSIRTETIQHFTARSRS